VHKGRRLKKESGPRREAARRLSWKNHRGLIRELGQEGVEPSRAASKLFSSWNRKTSHRLAEDMPKREETSAAVLVARGKESHPPLDSERGEADQGGRSWMMHGW